ncbi:MAG TPA: 50S ribosomal protein L13 [Planctomycetota bacterium]|nr:50S ribosomal protein L13 [Planctomycetota bacterium]
MKLRKTTYMAKKDEVARRWLLVDARGKVFGRLAVKVARVLQGKHRPNYTPHVDTGDYVVVVHAGEVKLTGKKLTDKTYTRYSGYPGGLRRVPAGEVLAAHPDRLFRDAVRRMLPKNRLARKMLQKLKVFGGDLPDHGFRAQRLEPTDL